MQIAVRGNQASDTMQPMDVQQTGKHKMYIFRPQIHCKQWMNIKLDHTKYIFLGLRYTATNGCTTNWITKNVYL